MVKSFFHNFNKSFERNKIFCPKKSPTWVLYEFDRKTTWESEKVSRTKCTLISFLLNWQKSDLGEWKNWSTVNKFFSSWTEYFSKKKKSLFFKCKKLIFHFLFKKWMSNPRHFIFWYFLKLIFFFLNKVTRLRPLFWQKK